MAERPHESYRDSPTYWFVIWDAARTKGDFDLAAEAQRELERLGVKVTYRPKSTRREAIHAE